jgi:hypothetical protein
MSQNEFHELEEGLRRLLTGTCCLIGAEQREATVLFEKTKALLLQGVPPRGSSQGNSKIRDLLEVAGSRLAAGQGDAFRQTIRDLLAELKAASRPAAS